MRERFGDEWKWKKKKRRIFGTFKKRIKLFKMNQSDESSFNFSFFLQKYKETNDVEFVELFLFWNNNYSNHWSSKRHFFVLIKLKISQMKREKKQISSFKHLTCIIMTIRNDYRIHIYVKKEKKKDGKLCAYISSDLYGSWWVIDEMDSCLVFFFFTRFEYNQHYILHSLISQLKSIHDARTKESATRMASTYFFFFFFRICAFILNGISTVMRWLGVYLFRVLHSLLLFLFFLLLLIHFICLITHT